MKDMDPLSDILRSLRLQSGLISRASLSTPWALRSSNAPSGLFHAVLSGDAVISVNGAPPVSLRAGDVALLPGGAPHVISDRAGRSGHPIAKLPKVDDGTAVKRLVHGGGGRNTELLCGSFKLQNAPANAALIDGLPDLMHLHGDTEPLAPWLEANIKLLGPVLARDRPGTQALVSGMTDLFFVRALRAWAASTDLDVQGWLAALREPRIAEALAAVHRDPSAPHTGASLAAAAGMSRTRFHERFREVVGETPARYLAAWRMRSACDRLREHPDRSTAEIGEQVGYRSEDAFCRAFRREIGVSPSAWRRQRIAS